MVTDKITAITKSTPVSTALLLVACSGAWWTGAQYSAFRHRLEEQEQANDKQDEWLEKLTQLVADNKRRLDIAEARQ